jgi:flagellar biosynthesis protein FliQ
MQFTCLCQCTTKLQELRISGQPKIVQHVCAERQKENWIKHQINQNVRYSKQKNNPHSPFIMLTIQASVDGVCVFYLKKLLEILMYIFLWHIFVQRTLSLIEA